jgi:hypothetical protein
VEAAAACYLIEAELSEPTRFDWGKVTQEDETQPPSNWQVAYDEQSLDEEKRRWVFFFHHLDLGKPLLTPAGPIPLPAPTPRPTHLKYIAYTAP